MIAEQVLHGVDGGADALDQRIAVARIADRGREHVGDAHRAVVAQQRHPGVEGAGNAGRQQPGAGHQIEAELVAVMRDGGAGRHRPLPADHLGLAAPHVVEDHRHVAARAVEVRLDHLQRERGRAGGVEGVAAALQDAHADRGRDPVGRGDDAEGALDLGAGGERIRIDEIHAVLPGLRRKTPDLTTVPQAGQRAFGAGQPCNHASIGSVEAACARSCSGARHRASRILAQSSTFWIASRISARKLSSCVIAPPALAAIELDEMPAPALGQRVPLAHRLDRRHEPQLSPMRRGLPAQESSAGQQRPTHRDKRDATTELETRLDANSRQVAPLAASVTRECLTGNRRNAARSAGLVDNARDYFREPLPNRIGPARRPTV